MDNIEQSDNGWTATYRLQMHAGFDFDAAVRVLPYLVKLGISHVYLSPCLQAAPGSTHGYDVADPTRINEELGGEEGWSRFLGAVRENGLKVLLDIVPNHMATHTSNPWWDDVLAHGPNSACAGYFDIFPLERGAGWRINLSVLGTPYGQFLDDKASRVDFSSGLPRLKYHDRSWPLCPASWGLIFNGAEPGWKDLFNELALYGTEPSETDGETYFNLVDEAVDVVKRLTGDAASLERLQQHADELACDPERFHAILEAQFYKLCWWKLEGEAVNYRRFFNIGSLIGLRVEDERVFDASHARVRKMIEAGEIDGLRIDHPDGLREPAAYFERLRELLPDGRIYIEKILDTAETLPDTWAVSGSVGYEFLSLVNRLWMDEHKADAFNAIYADFTGHTVNFPVLLRQKKFEMLNGSFSADLERLTNTAYGISQTSVATRDTSRVQLEEAIRALIVLLPVYRTYRSAGSETSQVDAKLITDVLGAARGLCPTVDPSIFNFLEGILTGGMSDFPHADFVLRWQQLTPPVMAKGAEDTAFYCYDRLVSANEVGSQASAFGVSAEQFHQACSYMASHWPANLLSTSTHDTKRSEDVRTRISLLSEIPGEFSSAIQAWAKLNESAWKGRTPDRHAEYLLYQTLIGAWPIDAKRANEYMLKACREAKINTTWNEPNEAYERAVCEFVDAIIESPEFVAAIEEFIAPLVKAGRINSLAQTLIKLTAPGTPDFYQGSELWDLSLVDPDNRRPVDYAKRMELLNHCPSSVEEACADWDSGLPKLWMIARTLKFRREMEQCFAPGASYQPLSAKGSKLGHLLTFLRNGKVAVIVPRFALSLKDGWDDTAIVLPTGQWRNILTDALLEGDTGAEDIFGAFPVALLHLSEGSHS